MQNQCRLRKRREWLALVRCVLTIVEEAHESTQLHRKRFVTVRPFETMTTAFREAKVAIGVW